MGADQVFVLSSLGQGWLIRSHGDAEDVFPLVTRLRHAKQKMCLVILLANRILLAGSGRIDISNSDRELLISHSETATFAVVYSNLDSISAVRLFREPKFHFKLEPLFSESDQFIGGSQYWPPIRFARRSRTYLRCSPLEYTRGQCRVGNGKHRGHCSCRWRLHQRSH